jgi:hypothetical protein
MTKILKLHEPGIYFGMTSEEYHSDPALGSTDLRALMKSLRKYWLRSVRNPARARYEEPDTKQTVMGTAIHTFLLDGEAAFYKKYARRPDDVINATSGQKAAVTKAANEQAKAAGVISLHGDDWELIQDIKWLIPSHPDLAEVLVGGEHEVSIFWEDERTGVPLKCRFDILKPAGIGDVKSIANESDLRLEIAAKLAIKRYKYHIQAEHYLEGRRQLPQFFKHGKIWWIGTVGAPPQSTYDFLGSCTATKKFGFGLVFVSKSLPELWACTLFPGNPMLQMARDRIDLALDQYVKMSDQAKEQEWPETWRLAELDMTEMPGGEFGWD